MTCVFAGLARAAGIIILVALAGVAVFLTVEGIPAFTRPSETSPLGAPRLPSYVWPLVFGTLLAAALALLIAAPLAIGVALVISHYAPRRLAGRSATPSTCWPPCPRVVYGLWGIGFLAPRLTPLYDWLSRPPRASCRSSRARPQHRPHHPHRVHRAGDHGAADHHRDLPRDLRPDPAACTRRRRWRSGATRWEMIRMTVFPYARSGMVSAVMLGLGRALGETMAVAMVLSASGVVTFNLISNTNPATIASNIALKFPEATGVKVNVLIASGLVLFVDHVRRQLRRPRDRRAAAQREAS